MRFLLELSLFAAMVPALCAAVLPDGITFRTGAVNVVTIGSDAAVYGAPAKGFPARGRVLLTHVRRHAIGSLPADAEVFAPAAEADLLRKPETFWNAMETGRFHDYAQTSGKVPAVAAAKVGSVEDGSEIRAGAVSIKALATPGYTPGAVSYVIEAGGKRVVCSGDLIYGNGQMLELFSLQDAVPEAKARGYHGYAARAGDAIRVYGRLPR